MPANRTSPHPPRPGHALAPHRRLRPVHPYPPTSCLSLANGSTPHHQPATPKSAPGRSAGGWDAGCSRGLWTSSQDPNGLGRGDGAGVSRYGFVSSQQSHPELHLCPRTQYKSFFSFPDVCGPPRLLCPKGISLGSASSLCLLWYPTRWAGRLLQQRGRRVGPGRTCLASLPCVLPAGLTRGDSMLGILGDIFAQRQFIGQTS